MIETIEDAENRIIKLERELEHTKNVTRKLDERIRMLEKHKGDNY